MGSDNFFMMTILVMITVTVTITITVTITKTIYENENDNDNNDLFDCNNDISNEVNYILCDACFYFLNDIVGSTDKMSSMTYLYFTSKHTHPLRKTNNNPIYDCDKLYSNIQGEILLSQNKMLMTSIPTFREKFSSLRTRCL